MKQLVRIKKDFILQDVPVPVCDDTEVLVQNSCSLFVEEVEQNVLQANKGSIVTKMLQQRELLNFALTKLKKEGWFKTYSFGKAMMANWHTLGAFCCGKVLEVGTKVKDLSKDDYVVCTGWHAANHAEFVSVPRRLVAKVAAAEDPSLALLSPYGAKLLALLHILTIPVHASILIYGTTLGSKILQYLLKQQGHNPIFFSSDQITKIPSSSTKMDYLFTIHSDIDKKDLPVLKELCSPTTQYISISEKVVDGDIIKGLGCHHQSYHFFLSDRKLHLEKDEGRRLLDTLSQKDVDSFLDLVHKNPLPNFILPGKTISFSDVVNLYSHKNIEPIMVKYDPKPVLSRTINYFSDTKPTGRYGIAIIGAGNMARNVHIPILLQRSDAFVKYVFTHSGRSAASMAHHYHIPYATSSYEDILHDPEIEVVVILTHHATHASYALEAIKAGKNVFMEKPLCLTEKECQQLLQAYKKRKVVFSVGFNKTFSPLALEVKQVFAQRKHPLFISYRLQAPLNYNKPWYYEAAVGGGRLLGEYGHLFDFAYWLVGEQATVISAVPLSSTDPYFLSESNVVVILSFKDGSIATLLCSEDGNTHIAKEHLEIIADNTVVILEDWESLTINGKKKNTRQQKGYEEHWQNFFAQLRGEKVPLIDLERAVAVFRLSLDATRKLHEIVKKKR